MKSGLKGSRQRNQPGRANQSVERADGTRQTLSKQAGARAAAAAAAAAAAGAHKTPQTLKPPLPLPPRRGSLSSDSFLTMLSVRLNSSDGGRRA